MECILGVTCRHFCMHHACISGDKKRAVHIRRHYDIFCEKFAETNWIFEFPLRKYPISKKNRPKRSLESEVMIISKSTKFQRFFWKRPHGFQNFIQNLFGYFSLQKDKVDMCGHLNGAYTSSYLCRHLHLQQNIQQAQTCKVARSSWSEG
jgi:hypothetical protein